MEQAQEIAFDRFLECADYDEAEDAIFRLVRSAYAAGWRDCAAKRSDQERGTPDRAAKE